MTSASSTVTQPTIAIIGGGPAGLTTLLSLHNRGVKATLYEREASSKSRAYVGGMLDLTWDEGQRALRENGLAEVFKKNSRLEAQESRLCGKDGVVLAGRTEADIPDETKARPEIDRRVLREIMLAAILEDAIKWGHTLASVRPLADGTGKHELTFANGAVVVSDYLIGADGANSRVRPLVSSATPIYYGVNGAEISIPPAVAALPENAAIRDAVGLGTCSCAEDGKVISCQRNGDGRIRAYVWFRGSLDWKLPHEPQEARRVLHEMFEGWAAWVHKIIDVCADDAIYPRPLFYLPADHRWTHTPGLGTVLANAVSKGMSVEEREAALAAIEDKNCAHAQKFAEMSFQYVEIAFGPDVPQIFLDMYKHMSGED